MLATIGWRALHNQTSSLWRRDPIAGCSRYKVGNLLRFRLTTAFVT